MHPSLVPALLDGPLGDHADGRGPRPVGGNQQQTAAHSPPAAQPAVSNLHLRKLHERFVTDPAGTDLSVLRPVIARSWARSMQWSVRPDLRRFDEYRDPRTDDLLMQCAGPILDELERVSADTGAIIYLADQDGTIAAVRGGDSGGGKVVEVAEPGTAMAEDITGTNSDGTALEEGRPVQVWGAEHFCEGMQHLCCTSVPVLDPIRRSVRAVLSLSIPEANTNENDKRSMALIAQGAVAELIERLKARLAVREQALMASYLAELRKRGGDAVVVMDDRTTIASKDAMHILRQSDYAVLAGYAQESERLAHTVERDVVLGSGMALQVHAAPVLSAGESIGSIIRLRSPKQRKKSGLLTTSSPQRMDGFDSVVGESRALRRTVDVARTAVRRRMPAYVVGERGTGKTHLANAMAHELAVHILTMDCADEPKFDQAEIDRVGVQLKEGGAVVLRHADHLSANACAALTDLVQSQEYPAIILTMGSIRDGILPLTNGLAGVEIEMPPLRNRREDIPLLVAAFLAGATHGVSRVSPALLRAITETDWIGNVGQLRDFINTAAGRCSFAELDFGNLSDSQRRAIARVRLSRLEEAELHQIRVALGDAGGNRVQASELLQIGRSTLYRKIDSYTRRGFSLDS